MALTTIDDRGLKTPIDLLDNEKIRFGTGNDLEIYHNGSNNYIIGATGQNTYIGATNGQIQLQPVYGTDHGIIIKPNDAVELYHDGTKKLETTTDGVTFTGDTIVNGAGDTAMRWALSGTNKWSIFHNTSGSSNHLEIYDNNGSGSAAKFFTNGAVELYHDNSKKLNTESWGVEVVGTLRADVLNLLDDEKIKIGASSDLEIYHDGSNTYIDNHTGNMYIRNGGGDTILIQPLDGEDAIKAYGNGRVELAYDNVKKFETTSDGVAVTGDATVSGGLFADGDLWIVDQLRHTGDTNTAIRFPAADTITAETNNTERFRIDSNGFITHKFTYDNSTTADGFFINNMAANTGDNASLAFSTDSGSRKKSAISHVDTGNYGRGDLVFSIDPDADSGELDIVAHEKMRITSGGQLNIGTTVDALGVDTGNNTGINLTGTGRIYIKSNDHSECNIIGGGEAIRFRYGYTDGTTQADCGSIDITGTNSTAYNTSSDYRLKENQVAITNAITRLKLLKPYRFNFKSEPSKTVDGFFAHEVTPAVPEAITGEKDGERMQGIDQSKLVPLLTAALQEAIAKIETLETKVTALEAK